MLLTLNDPDVVHEVIDDELVLLNLRSGAYYSGNSTATALLEALIAQPDAAVLLEAVGSLAEDARSVLDDTITYLLTEGLLKQPLPGVVTAVDPSALDMAAVQKLVDLLEVDPPRFEKFTDMREILLLDPVHDTGDRGWPWQPGA